MKVLIACEESQTVCTAFRAWGHDAFSCDILTTSGKFPEYHIVGNVLDYLHEDWDIIIAHPPCTYLSNAGAKHLFRGHTLNKERYAKGLEAKAFFMSLFNSNINKICIENPIPSKIYGLPKYDQIIQPYQFGHPVTKKTCLWLKNLPPLLPTKIIEPQQTTRLAGNWFNKGGKERQANRSKTFIGIAEAMAEQYGGLDL